MRGLLDDETIVVCPLRRRLPTAEETVAAVVTEEEVLVFTDATDGNDILLLFGDNIWATEDDNWAAEVTTELLWDEIVDKFNGDEEEEINAALPLPPPPCENDVSTNDWGCAVISR